jgi:Family of unknown function (DUF6113)
MVGRLTSLLNSWSNSTVSRLLNLLRAILVGLFLGTIGILFHNSFSPVGLIVALLEGGIGFYFFAKYYPGRFTNLLAVFSWLVVVYRAASFGVSNEILIEGNTSGFIFLLGGLAINFIGLIRGRKFK